VEFVELRVFGHDGGGGIGEFELTRKVSKLETQVLSSVFWMADSRVLAGVEASCSIFGGGW